MKAILLSLCLAVASCGLAWGHPGGTDGDGCHIDPNDGRYHCH